MQDGRIEILKNQSAIDRIINYLRDTTPQRQKLSFEDDLLLKRIDEADDLIRQYGSDKMVAPMLMAKFKISKATAYEVIRKAKWVYGTLFKSEKDYERRNILEQLATIYKSCFDANDWKHALKALELRSRILRLQEEDPDIPDWTKIQEHTFIIEYNPEIAGGKKLENIEEVVSRYLQKKKEKFIESLPEATIEKHA